MEQPRTEHFLQGWTLAWSRVEQRPSAEAWTGLATTVDGVREQLSQEDLTGQPEITGMRRLFRAAGTDPTRWRPSSEALLRRVLKGQGLARIHPLVDLNNALSLQLRVPACVMPEGSFSWPVGLRSGHQGEKMTTLRGEIDLAGKPVLLDSDGPFGTPISDSLRVKVLPETRCAWLVVYLPTGVVEVARVEADLVRLAGDDFDCGPVVGA